MTSPTIKPERKPDRLMEMVASNREAIAKAQIVINRALGYIHHSPNYNEVFHYDNFIVYTNNHGPFVLIGMDYTKYLAFIRLYNKCSEDSFYKTEFKKNTGVKYDDILGFGMLEDKVKAVVSNQFVRYENGMFVGIDSQRKPIKYTNSILAMRSFTNVLNTQYILGAYIDEESPFFTNYNTEN